MVNELMLLGNSYQRKAGLKADEPLLQEVKIKRLNIILYNVSQFLLLLFHMILYIADTNLSITR